MAEKIHITAKIPDKGPLRLDVYLSESLKRFTRSRIQKLIESGLVRVEGRIEKPSTKIKGGECIEIAVPEERALKLVPQALPLEVVFDDDDLAVINKPCGMVVHPGAGIHQGTLVNALLYHMQGSLSGIGGVLRPGIVHRLDKDTSGLLVIAKNDLSHESLSKQIQEKTASRQYLALLEGRLESQEGTIDKAIGRHPLKRKEMAVLERGRKAVSHYKVIARYRQYTLVRVSLETGRTHQIRVHMANLGFPVVGDLIYNSKLTGSLKARHKLGLQGHALHATFLSFVHPRTGCLLEFEAPIPRDFHKLIDSLEEE